MTVRESLDLSNFAPAVEQLAAQIDSVSSDERLIADAAVALCSGIVAMAVFQKAPDGPPVGNWEGALDDHSLCLFSTQHQLVFTLKNNMFQAAVLSGPSGNTWNVLRSEQGLHVQVANSSAEIVKDRLIKNDGSIVDTADASTAIDKLRSELQKIANIPESSLPDYVPVGDLIDVDLPDAESLPDVNSSLPGGNKGSGPHGGGSPGSGGSSPGAAPSDFGAFPFPKDMPGASSGFAGKAANAAGNLLKGAAAVVAAGVVGHAVKTAGQSAQNNPATPPAHRQTAEPELVLEITDAAPVSVRVFPWVLGRGTDCQTVLSSRLVSRKHAQIVMYEDQICFEDLGSSNGSWLNGEKPSDKVPIYKGDELKIADVIVTIVDGPEKPKPESANMPTMMFSFPESSQKTGQIPAVVLPPPKPPAMPAPPAPSAPPASSRPAAANSSSKPAVPPPPRQTEPPGAALPKPPKPGTPARPAPVVSPPPPPQDNNDDDYIARAVQAARSRSGEPVPQNKPADASQNRRTAQESGEAPGQIKQAAPEDLRALPSVRWVSYIFGFFFIIENLNILIVTNGGALEQANFIIAAAFGGVMVFFAFIAGNSRGFFRFLTMVTAGAYVGTRLYHEYALLASIIEHISAVQDNPMIVLPLLSIATAAWITKRAASR